MCEYDNECRHLLQSIKRGCPICFGSFVERDNVEACDRANRSSLHQAIYYDRDFCIPFLCTEGADIHKVNSMGRGVLHQAVVWSGFRSIELLLKYGANVNLQDKKGNTPLHKAIVFFKYQSSEANYIKLLLRNGADPSIQNAKGETVIDRARAKGTYDQLVSIFEDYANNRPLTYIGDKYEKGPHPNTAVQKTVSYMPSGILNDSLM